MTVDEQVILRARDIIGLFGGPKALASGLQEASWVMGGVSEATVGNWSKRNSIPGPWIYPIYCLARRRSMRGVSMRVLLEHMAELTTMSQQAIMDERDR